MCIPLHSIMILRFIHAIVRYQYIPFYGQIIFQTFLLLHHILFIHSSVDEHCVIFTFWLLWIVLWTFMNKLFEYLFLILMDTT